MPRLRTLPVGLGTVLGLILPVLVVGPVAAQKIDGDTFHEEDSFVVTDFCAPGVTVRGDVTVDGRFLERLGPDGIVYFVSHEHQVIVWTNLDTQQHATDVQPNTVIKDLKITDNGDGTITIIELLAGAGKLYGDHGDFIAKGDGQVRFRQVIDTNGTLDNPDDDTLLSNDLIFGSTGTNDDYCAAILADWGITP